MSGCITLYTVDYLIYQLNTIILQHISALKNDGAPINKSLQSTYYSMSQVHPAPRRAPTKPQVKQAWEPSETDVKVSGCMHTCMHAFNKIPLSSIYTVIRIVRVNLVLLAARSKNMEWWDCFIFYRLHIHSWSIYRCGGGGVGQAEICAPNWNDIYMSWHHQLNWVACMH